MRQPIKVESHSLIDFGFAAVSTIAPLALGLQGLARTIPLGWGLQQGALNALTDQPYALDDRLPRQGYGWPMLTIQEMPKRLMQAPNSSPHICFSRPP